jgi:membrane-bound lytic murein transglycosylase MltF
MIATRAHVTGYGKRAAGLLGALALHGVVAVQVFSQDRASESRTLPTRPAAMIKMDFDGLLVRRAIRVAVPYSRTLYFNDKGRERGISAEFVRDFERWINEKYRTQLGKRPITVVIRPTTRDLLLNQVADGLADIAVGNLTATEERRKIVDFVTAESVKPVSEVVLTGPRSPQIASAADLSGKTVHVRRSSSYRESLEELNARLTEAGRPPVNLVFVPDALEDEDMMEMLNAGLLDAIIVDDWLADIWTQILPHIRVNGEAVVRSGAMIGWAIRKNSPKLAAELNEFYTSFLHRRGVYQARVRQHYVRIKQIKDPSEASERNRFETTLAFFKKYGGQYDFDPLMLVAQGYQESQLNQAAKSRAGAIGIMQLMPATGKELKVGDITIAENNVHAGAKYMDQLMTKHLAGARFDETNRTLFAFACYNAGPTNIARMRKEAARRGFDPDQWFNNVELVTAEKIGSETTTYVRNIYKYYVAYKLMLDVEEAQRKARDALQN